MMMMMGFWLIVPLLLIGVVVLAIGLTGYSLGLRPRLNQTRSSPADQTQLEILKARYAGGEITREEYEQARRDLEG